MMKKVLVTGACGGMGRAICELLIQCGYEVYGIDLRKNTDISGLNFTKCDVTDISSVESAFENISAKAGKLDAIIHTAGIYDLDSLIEMDEERFTRIMDINLFGVYRINKAFVPLLSDGGRVIITTSELAPLDPLPFTGIYAISKAALEKYAYSLRMELNLLGISVSVIRPGAVKTSLLGDSTAALERFCGSTKIYRYNADKFRKIVDSVEAKNVPPIEIARIAKKALEARRPKYVYNINRNILLRLLNILPEHMQVTVIKRVIGEK